MSKEKYQIETHAVQAGIRGAKPDYVPNTPPIYTSTAFCYESMSDLDAVFAGEREGYVYTRFGNPTVEALQEAVRQIEGAETATAFASGMAAINTTLMSLGLQSGDAILAARDLYGTTYVLLTQQIRSLGIEVHFVDTTDLSAVEAQLNACKPKVLMIETISNPLLRIADIPALTELAHNHGACLMVDSTFATPCLVNPLGLGADIVMHSATKYLGGHGDVLGGVVATSAERRAQLQEVLKLTGANLGPHEAALILRGIRTLPLRMQRHFENALEVAKWLEAHSRVERVNYPGLPSHPQHELAKSMFGGRGFGGMVSFEIKGAGRTEVFKFMESLKLCLPATTLGEVCTLVLYPAHSSHRGLSQAERDSFGISDSLVRLSVGIESTKDIIADLDQALA